MQKDFRTSSWYNYKVIVHLQTAQQRVMVGIVLVGIVYFFLILFILFFCHRELWGSSITFRPTNLLWLLCCLVCSQDSVTLVSPFQLSKFHYSVILRLHGSMKSAKPSDWQSDVFALKEEKGLSSYLGHGINSGNCPFPHLRTLLNVHALKLLRWEFWEIWYWQGIFTLAFSMHTLHIRGVL